MGVPRRGLHLGVPEQFPDHGQAFAKRQRPRSKRMTQIMDPHVLQTRTFADAPPGALQIGEVRAGEVARDDPGVVLLTGNG